MNKSYYRKYNPNSDFEVVTNLQLRQADVDEIKASSGMTPREALLLACVFHDNNRDQMFIIIHKDQIEGVFGINSIGVIWFLATDKFKEFSFSFARESKDFIKSLSDYKKLYNYVSVNHAEAIKWLQWLGFKIDFDNPVNSSHGGEFYYFCKNAGDK